MKVPVPRPVVVCVDDEPETLAALHRALGREPYSLLMTDRPEEALRWTREREIAVVVADQRMPGMTGSDLLAAVRKGSPGTVSLMLTAFPDARARAQCSSGLIRRLMTKPWDGRALKEAILEALREGRRASPPTPPDTEDVVHSIDLAGRRSDEARATVLPLFQFAHARDRGVFVFLRNLRSFHGSIPGLLWDLACSARESGVRLALADATGLACAFAESFGSLAPLSAFGPRAGAIRPRRVLIVEDDADSRDFLGAVVASEGHSHEGARTAAEARRLLDAGGFDLVLLDLDLPDGDGAQVAEAAAACGPAVPVIVVSAFLDRWGEESYRRLGVRGRVGKPYRVKDILELIRSC